jgi:SWI/SNF-related matrix-associated actin-dependent regulator 1 of chromatin subfamily A
MEILQNTTHYIIRVTPAAPDFAQKLAAIKKIPGREYRELMKAWTVPIKNYPDMKVLMTAIQRHMKAPAPPVEGPLIIDPLPELTEDIQLKQQLYNFQRGGVAYCLEKGNCMIGDQQGLGKTAQAIAAVIARNLFPCLVVTKKSLVLNWKMEWEAWTDKQVMGFTPARKNTWPFFFNTRMADVGIVNYESLQPFFVARISTPAGEVFRVKHIEFKEQIQLFKSVIIDESHYVKDGKTKRTKFCIGLTRHLQERGVYLLSGTPVLNDPEELYTQLTILNRQRLFGSFAEFKLTYSGKHNKGNLKKLNYLLHKQCYYRRLKSEAKADLPPKTRQVMLVDIDNRDEYDMAEQNFVKYLKERMALSQGQVNQKLRSEVLVQMGILKKIAAKGKLPAVKEWTQDLLDQEEKVVLFAYHREVQAELVKSFKNSVAIASQEVTPMSVIQENKRLFMTSKTHNVIVCSISAAAEGHTLNAASNLAMTELPWHFGKAEQCEDRIHRITNWLPANITYILAENTIDRHIYKVIMDKKDMHDAVTGTEEEEETKVIDKLINIFNQK